MVHQEVRTPGYLDVLNTICVEEGRAGAYFQAWSDKTQDPALKQCLALVAAREISHSHIFKRRISELGFELREKGDPDYPEQLRIASSDMPDSEKIKAFEEIDQRRPKPTVEESCEAAKEDEAVDPLTRSLLSWWADEEADSVKVMTDTYAKVQGVS